MMICVILGHPRKGSFNHALARAACRALRGAGHQVRFHDLAAEGFDPELSPAEMKGRFSAPLRRHLDELARADGFVIVHPNWWGMPPAVLKGWIDRVFRSGVAYRFEEGDSGEGVPCGLLKARAVLILNTSDTARTREEKVFGDPLETLWKNCVFGFCGVKNVKRHVYRIVVTSTPARRARWLADADRRVRACFPPEKAGARRRRKSPR